MLSKAQGGEWGIAHLPQQYHTLLEKALTAYRADGAFTHDADALRAFAAEMLKEIL